MCPPGKSVIKRYGGGLKDVLGIKGTFPVRRLIQVLHKRPLVSSCVYVVVLESRAYTSKSYAIRLVGYIL